MTHSPPANSSKNRPPNPFTGGTSTEETDWFEDVLDHMLDVITIINASGVIAYQSKSITQMLGYAPEPMLGKEVSSYIHPEDRPLVAAALAQLFSGTLQTNQAQFRFRHKNNNYRRIHAVAKLWERNGVSLVMVNSRDITSEHEDREELARQNELLAKTFALSKNLLSITLPSSGKLIKVNDAWCETFGQRRERVIGKTALELGIWGSVENRNHVIGEFERQGKLQNYEATVFTRTGEERQLTIDAKLLLVGDQPQILMSCTDITDSNRIEEELRHSQKMDAIGQLTGGVAHDFNNLIGVTMGNAELLLDIVAEQPEALEHAQQILSAAERASTLTQQLLAFSRRQKLAPEPVNLAKHLMDASSILQTSVSENTVIDFHIDPDLWHCQVDPNQLQTAVLNLTLNAHDAMPNGGLLEFTLTNFTAKGGEKTINGHNVLGDIQSGDYVAFTISDTGCGMDTETRSRAFEPFFSTKDYGRGTGLGLSMVFGFVEQSGGTVCLESAQGKGTSIALLLPRASTVTNGSLNSLRPKDRAKRVHADTPKTVLVVEDNASLRSVLVRALGDMGYRVLEANGEEELPGVLNSITHLDLLLSDVILKDRKRGPEIASDVLRCFPEAAVLLMTGFSPDEVLLGTEYPVLMKPFTLVELSEVLHKLLAEAAPRLIKE